MKQGIDWILQRRSIRKYQDRLVDRDTIVSILKGAMAAPSARNRQPWHFVVVDRRELLDQLQETHPYASMLQQAPLCIAVCGDPEASRTGSKKEFWVQDCSAAMENLLLSVSSLGLGGVWLGVHPDQEREEKIGALLGLPGNIRVLGLAAIGYPAEEKSPNTYYDEEKVHYNSFGKPME